ncbi:MAG: fatty acid desaturase [Opitutaceae bacterium]|nr:fatty acid desaturase [Opitutaceae bacterium]
MIFGIPLKRVNWITSSFLILTALLAFTATPWYIWNHGIDLFQASLFFFYFCATGFSITLGYHRNFSHLSFKAKWPVRLFTLIFGAAAFENAALDWCSDHRKHHKHVDHDDDPYDITKGFFHAHIGWLLFRLHPLPPMDNVADLRRDSLVMWQYRWCQWIAVTVGFILPAAMGWMYGGPQAALGAFLIAGVARVVFVQHMAFFINSLCHTIGKQPYSTKHTARDSPLMAILTYGEGYHNYHHEFQHDYRNGVKPWQFDPTKWIIWSLNKVGLTSNLRRVPEDRILLAEATEARLQLDARLSCSKTQLSDKTRELLQASHDALSNLSQIISERHQEYLRATEKHLEHSKEIIEELRHELHLAIKRLAQVPIPVHVLS